MFLNVVNKMRGTNEEELDINDVFSLMKNEDNKQNIKLILKDNIKLLEIFKNKFESDIYLNYYKLESSFNFFLVNSYYKYLKQIVL